MECARQGHVLETLPFHDHVGENGVVHPLGDADRNPVTDRPPDQSGLLHEPALGSFGPLEYLGHRLVGTTRHVDQVDTGVGQHHREASRFVRLQTTVDILRCGYPVPDRIVHTYHLPDSRQHLEREAGPVPEGASVAVGPPVRLRGQELAQQVAMGAVQVDHVDPRLHTPPGRRHEVADYPANISVGHLSRVRSRIHEGRGNCGWGDRPAMVGGGRRLPASVLELHGELGAVPVELVGHAGESRNDVIAVTTHLVGVSQAFRRDVG